MTNVLVNVSAKLLDTIDNNGKCDKVVIVKDRYKNSRILYRAFLVDEPMEEKKC